MLVTASHQSGQDLFVSFDKEALKLVTKVSDHPLFSNEANWVMVSIVFKHKNSDKRLVSGFRNDFTKTDSVKIKPNMVDGEVYELHEILISGTDREPILSIQRFEILDAPIMDFVLGSSNKVSVSLTTMFPSIQTYFSDPANIYFYVEIKFGAPVIDFSAEKINITNGYVQNIDYYEFDGYVYVVRILPNSVGNMTVSVPEASVYTSDGKPNIQSNQISAQFIEAVQIETTSPDCEKNGTVTGPFDVIMTFSSPVYVYEPASIVQIINGTLSNFTVLSTINYVEDGENLIPYATTYRFTINPQNSGSVSAYLNQNSIMSQQGITTNPTSLFVVEYYKRPSVVLSTPLLTVNGNFVVTATFDQDMYGFTLNDVIVTNGTISSFDSTSHDQNGNPIGQIFTFTVTPIAEGVVTISIPQNIATGNNNTSNLPSNELDVVYEIIGYRYYKIGFKDAWTASDVGTKTNKMSLSDIKMSWDGSVQSMTGANMTYLVPSSSGTANLLDGTVYTSGNTYNSSQLKEWVLDTTTYTDLFQIDLGQKRDVTSIHFAPRTGYNYPRTFKIYASNDNSNWNELLSVSEKARTWEQYPSYKEFIIKPRTNEKIWNSNGAVKLNNVSYRYIKMSVKNSWRQHGSSDVGDGAYFAGMTFAWDEKFQDLSLLGANVTYLYPKLLQSHDLLTFEGTYFVNLNTNTFNDLFIIDLLSQRNIEYLLISPVGSYMIPKTFKVYGSNDNNNWTEILSMAQTVYDWYPDGGRIFGDMNGTALEPKWSTIANWNPKSLPNSSDVWANIYGQSDLTKSGEPKRYVYLDTNVTLNRIDIDSPTTTWNLKTGSYLKSINLSGTNPKINFDSLGQSHLIEVPIAVNGSGNLTISGNSSGPSSLTGQMTAINKNIDINISHPSSSLLMNNVNNNISGIITIDSTKTTLVSANSSSCSINWSNKAGNDVNTTVLSTSSQWGNINFLGDGNKKYLIANDIQTIYNGSFSGTIPNHLQLKNCTLNQPSNLVFPSGSNIIINSGTLEWDNLNALPSTPTIQLLNEKGVDYTSTNQISSCFVKLPANSSVSNPIKFDGQKLDSYLSSPATATFLFNNTTLSSTITFGSKSISEESPHYVCGLTFCGTGTFNGNVIGKGYSATISVGSSSYQNTVLDMNCNINLQYGGKINASYGILNFTGSATSAVTVGASGSLFGTGTITQNYSNTTIMLDNYLGGTLCPENYHTPNTSQFLTINGNLSSLGTIKFRFDSSGNSTKLVVNGNVFLGGTVAAQTGTTLTSGKTYTIVQYTGTRNGTFKTNNFGAGTTITYDDVNKRILVTKA